MHPPRHRLAILLLALAPLLGLVVLVGDSPVPPRPGPPPGAPDVVVAMGDSTMSGEGAGDYEPGTHGENGNWCHRSPAALINLVEGEPIDERINLSCSSARSEHLRLSGVGQHGTDSQTVQLDTLASEKRIRTVVIGLGANDDPRFSDVLGECFQAWFARNGPACTHGEFEEEWLDRVDRMVPKVTAVLDDVRSVLRDNGYPDSAYELVVQSYASPVGADLRRDLAGLTGCPFRTEDARWMQEVGVSALADGLRRAAEAADARFLDYSEAGVGRGACSAEDVSDEWFTRLTVDWSALEDQDRAPHAIQESFHPNAAGHRAFAQCLSEFLATTSDSARCVPDDDGGLRATSEEQLVSRATG
ncbi:GDSL-type esterase/lipase family protein [Actinoalloteichus hymeniacidonis]|uniref:GDSL-like Lipase/Acylhydrolase family n=1 Tax=Actinoalloteichus hymeniacidonis TaxID=340345 RepID=A0AAC9HPZ2_9PSEU|nr:GDSL-type esterase/lipase family protein [Actinoalloteichus hymeniacidonis]AOS63243.1 GDSL-like Lipase/Acylhydrolase family [Actinoalloteichus hymeniacidonis]MBB5908718.1 lysophospholipase L1-like esterase [Actinoalloteichus hymeniacidonis]